MVVLTLLMEWVAWDADPDHRERLRVWLPRVAAGLVAAKLVAAGWVLRVGVGRGRWTPAAAGTLAAAWVVTTAVLFAGLAWLVPPSLVAASGLALAVALFLPLARPAAAPLALAWNRHR
jgi:hypothetical protein